MAGRLQHSPARVTQQLLIDLELGVAPSVPTPPNIVAHTDWSVFYDSMPNSPDKVIVVTDTQANSFLNDGFGERNIHHGIQVRVRAGTHDTGWDKANEIAYTLDRQRNARGVEVAGVNYCIAVVKVVGDVLRMGPEPNSTRRNYSINLLVAVLAM